jgi:outer membrane protein, multidrug efflux system
VTLLERGYGLARFAALWIRLRRGHGRIVMRNSRVALAALLSLAAVGCTAVGPDYTEPEIAVPQNWNEKLEGGLAVGESDIAAWWKVFGDPTLDSFVLRAAAQNLDVRQAIGRIDETRALYGVAKGDRYPQVNALGDAMLIDPAANSPSTARGTGGHAYDSYALGLDASWELDVFGRVRRSIEAAGANYQATVEDMRAIRVALAAEVARAYVELRSQQERLAIAQANVASQQGSLDLATSRQQLGLAPELDVAQAQTNLSSTESSIPAFSADIARSKHRLAVLLGGAPGSLDAELASVKPVPALPDRVVVDLPANLVRRRPDVRAAERRLAYSTALEGVETADLYPSFSLFGAFGLRSGDLGTLLEPDSVGFQVGPLFHWNLLDFGRVKSRIGAQNARTGQALAAYEAAILGALQEVEDSIAGYSGETIRRDKLRAAETSAKRTVQLAQDLYRGGLTNFQSVLDAERQLLQIQDTRASVEAQVVVELIHLYKALGGGFALDAAESDPEAAPKSE